MNRQAVLSAVLLCCTAPLAHALDERDQGEYVVLNTEERPTAMQMRFFLSGAQWMVDGRQAPQAWRPVCRAEGPCRLIDADENDILAWKAVLPRHWQPLAFSCIKNQSMAFCRVTHSQDPNRRAYWMFALLNQPAQAIPLNRLR